MNRSRFFTVGGIVASIVLVVAGIGTIAVATSGKSDVRDKLEAEGIEGGDDMTPELIREAIAEAGLEDVDEPDCEVAGEPVDDGDSAKCFADYMRIHALAITGGKTYAEMPRFATDDGAGTNDAAEASKNPDTGEPVSNPERNVWVTETALSTALNTSYFAEQVAMFSMLMGIALLLTGIGFLVLTLGLNRRSSDAGPPSA